MLQPPLPELAKEDMYQYSCTPKISDLRSKSVTQTHKTTNALSPSSKFSKPSSQEQNAREPGAATQKFKPEARIQECEKCEKLLCVLQKVLFDNVSRMGLLLFMGMLNSFCRENCTEHRISAQA